MKTTILFVAVVIGALIVDCTNSKEKNAEELLSNPKTQNEVFDAILNNHEYSSKIIDKMMLNEYSKKIITSNNSIAKMVCMSEKTDSLFNSDKEVMDKMTDRMLRSMQKDSSVCDKTCTRIMANAYLRNYFTTQAKKQVIKPSESK